MTNSMETSESTRSCPSKLKGKERKKKIFLGLPLLQTYPGKEMAKVIVLQTFVAKLWSAIENSRAVIN